MLHYYTIRPRGYLNEAALSKGQIYMSTLKLFLHLFKHMLFTPNQNEHLFTTTALDLWLKLMTQSSCNPTAPCNLNSHASRLSRVTVKTLSIQFYPDNNIFIIISRGNLDKEKTFYCRWRNEHHTFYFASCIKVGTFWQRKKVKERICIYGKTDFTFHF